MSYTVGQVVEARSFKSWEAAKVTQVNEDGTCDVAFVERGTAGPSKGKSRVGKAWRPSNVRAIDNLKTFWDSLDTDTSGTLNWKELSDAIHAGKLKEFGLDSINDLVLEVLDMDGSGDGLVSFVEFKTWVDNVRSGKEKVDDGDAPEEEEAPAEEEQDPVKYSLMNFWNSIDTDGNRKLDWKELDAAVHAGKLKEFGLDSINDLVLEVLDMDGSGDGLVSFLEFNTWVNNVRSGKEKVEDADAPEEDTSAADIASKKLWDSVDADADGHASFSELLKAVKAGKLEEFGLKGASDLILHPSLGKMDANDDDKVNYEEFKEWVANLAAGKDVKVPRRRTSF